jgi:uncharacterized repeat protein (TIGR03806 family)
VRYSLGVRPYALASFLCSIVAIAAAAACGEDDPVEPRTPCNPPPRVTGGVALAPALGAEKFTQPVELIFGPGNRAYVVEQPGTIKAVQGGGAPTTVLDVRGRIFAGGEAGLLSLAFDPKFAENGFAYMYFTQDVDKKPNVPFQTMVIRLTSKDGGATFDPTTEKLILKLDQPYSNHNGGHIAFGPDGLLYIGLGDGGSGGDPQGNGQNKDVLLGKILRVDTSSQTEPYTIPPTNPFIAGGGRPEIYAYGLRNPWKFSFDKLTGDLWCADVGQSKLEEVERIVLGGNYGWNVREGNQCYNAKECATAGFIDPIATYGRQDGVSVSGGYVYRGTKIKAIVGKFIYGDFGTGNIWGVDTFGPPSGILLTGSTMRISTFGQDADGEVYVADYASGTIQQLIEASPGGPAPLDAAGARLSMTGCLDPKNAAQAPTGAIPYTVSSPLWSDGAQKSRWLFVPDGSKIGVRPDGDFDVPPATAAVKTFTVGGKKIETRLFVRYADGGWAGYSYEWNDDESDALLLQDSKTKPLANGATWYFPSRAECFACHTPSAGFTLGLEARQLTQDGVIDRFASVLEAPIAQNAFPPLRTADTAGASSEERARGYLHANCSICHREGSGTGAATLDLRIDRAFKDTRTCNVAPQAGDLGVVDSKLITPGDPSKSTITLRMRALDQNRMPNVATRVVDEVGATAVETWIRELTACP